MVVVFREKKKINIWRNTSIINMELADFYLIGVYLFYNVMLASAVELILLLSKANTQNAYR